MENTSQPSSGAAVPESVLPLDLPRLISHDPRAAHFVVDILAGVTPDEAVGRHFPRGDDGDGDAIGEAERRGYLRGLNEAAQAKMDEPAMYEPADELLDTDSVQKPMFLSHSRKSVWD